jgi:hypothetical protein
MDAVIMSVVLVISLISPVECAGEVPQTYTRFSVLSIRQKSYKSPTLCQGFIFVADRTRAEFRHLDTQQTTKLLATEMDFWRRSARKSRKEKVRNVTISEIMEVGKNDGLDM